MRRYVILAVVIAAIGIIAYQITSSSSADSIVASEDVGVLFAGAGKKVEYIDIAPGIDRNRALGIATADFEDTFNKAVRENVVVKATVGKYSGPSYVSESNASRKEVWAIVFDNLDVAVPGGPVDVTLGDDEDPPQRTSDTQFNVIVDASTEDIIYSVLSGRILPVADQNPSG